MLDHPHLSPREMLYEICRITGGWWDRKVAPDEIGMKITMERRYPLFLAYVDDIKGEPAGTPTQSIDNLLNELEWSECEKCGGSEMLPDALGGRACSSCGHRIAC